MNALLWCVALGCAAALVYPYLGYPLLLRWLAETFPRPEPADRDDVPLPAVELIISAYNEESVIGDKLANALALDYPPERLRVTVVSDASSDRTDEIVTALSRSEPRVRLLRVEGRVGKTAGLNQAVARAEAPVIVFSDANALYAPDALRALVRPFADPAVGYAVGAQLYRAPEGGAGETEDLYWGRELRLKALESRFHSVVGGDGAIYAIRRELYWPLRADDINDFVNPLQIIASGHRGAFVAEARCYEHYTEEFAKEFRRKRRIVNRSWRAVSRHAGALRWRRDARFLFCLISHKVLRWFGMLFLAVGTLAALLLYLRTASDVAGLGLAAVGLSALVAVGARTLDAAGRSLPRPIGACYYFYLANLAALLGIFDELRGVRHVTWEHVRGPS